MKTTAGRGKRKKEAKNETTFFHSKYLDGVHGKVHEYMFMLILKGCKQTAAMELQKCFLVNDRKSNK